MNDSKLTTASEQIDARCCGSDACVIDTEGNCWCGQKWDGEKMCYPVANSAQCSPP